MGKGYRVRAGELRHRLELFNVSRTTSNTGMVGIGYEFVRKIWGSIETLSGNELTQARQSFPRATNKIRMRYVKGLNEAMQIKHKGLIYNIDSVNNVDQRNKVFEIIATENKGTTGDSSGI